MTPELAALGALRFAHQAMNTEFEIFCVHEDREYARQAAWAAFDLLDGMEHDLSRFIENSDVSRINALAMGETARVSRWTMECLEIARRAYAETKGAFDISLGSGLNHLQIVPREFTVRATTIGVRLDLGGIGKGYAVDRMTEVLAEWEIQQALIHGGHSSVRAMDAPAGLDGWPVTIDGKLVYVTRQAISASGIRKTDHILDPRTGRPVRDRPGVWVLMDAEGVASPCAVVEVWSTAYMISDVGHALACPVIKLRKPVCEQNSD